MRLRGHKHPYFNSTIRFRGESRSARSRGEDKKPGFSENPGFSNTKLRTVVTGIDDTSPKRKSASEEMGTFRGHEPFFL